TIVLTGRVRSVECEAGDEHPVARRKMLTVSKQVLPGHLGVQLCSIIILAFCDEMLRKVRELKPDARASRVPISEISAWEFRLSWSVRPTNFAFSLFRKLAGRAARSADDALCGISTPHTLGV